MNQNERTMNIFTVLDRVFPVYCQIYSNIFETFTPWKDTRKSINEANQVHHFLDAFTAVYPDAITWMELPVPDTNMDGKAYTARIDGFILSEKQKRIIFIEAKRFSRENKVNSLKDDVARIKRILDKAISNGSKLKGLDLNQYEVAALFLADAWDHKPEITNSLEEHLAKLKVDGMLMLRSGHCKVSEGYHLLYSLMEYSAKPCKQ